MDLMQGLLTRRSVRKYQAEKKISHHELKEIIKAGQYAPSAHNTQPWEFFVVEDKDDLAKFRTLQRASLFAENAAAVIIVCVDETKSFSREKEGWSYADVDGAAATMNILHAAHALGIGGCWCGCSPMTKPISDVKEYFKLPEHVKPFSIVVLGYPEGEVRQPETRYDETKIHFGKW